MQSPFCEPVSKTHRQSLPSHCLIICNTAQSIIEGISSSIIIRERRHVQLRTRIDKHVRAQSVAAVRDKRQQSSGSNGPRSWPQAVRTSVYWAHTEYLNLQAPIYNRSRRMKPDFWPSNTTNNSGRTTCNSASPFTTTNHTQHSFDPVAHSEDSAENQIITTTVPLGNRILHAFQ